MAPWQRSGLDRTRGPGVNGRARHTTHVPDARQRPRPESGAVRGTHLHHDGPFETDGAAAVAGDRAGRHQPVSNTLGSRVPGGSTANKATDT